MAKQIKVIKCPQCGNTKPQAIDKERYRCDKCGTEFFLDNDDINVNVRHSYGNSTTSNSSGSSNKTIFIVIAAVGLLFIMLLCFKVCSSIVKSTTSRTTTTPKVSSVKKENELSHVQLLQIGDKAIVFYFEIQNIYFGGEDTNGLYAVFYDIADKKVIEKKKISNNYRIKVEHRYFDSNLSHYYIINNQTIFKIDTKTYSLKNMNADIAQAKPALNSGFSTVYFVPEKNGDGFRLTTNLGKEFYYVPNKEQLYTDRAFKHMVDGGMNTVGKDAELRSYYLFQNKESKQSSNVAQLLKVAYMYNQGGPEDKLLTATASGLKDLSRHRITKVEPITDDRICFSAEVLYFDDTHILTSFRPTLASNAAYNIQLLTTKGEVLWTVSYGRSLAPNNVIRTKSSFYLLSNSDYVLEIKNNGQVGSEYNISKK